MKIWFKFLSTYEINTLSIIIYAVPTPYNSGVHVQHLRGLGEEGRLKLLNTSF